MEKDGAPTAGRLVAPQVPRPQSCFSRAQTQSSLAAQGAWEGQSSSIMQRGLILLTQRHLVFNVEFLLWKRNVVK